VTLGIGVRAPHTLRAPRPTHTQRRNSRDRETGRRRVCLPDGSGGARVQARSVSEVRHGTGAGYACRAGDTDGICLPDAPGDRAHRARFLPDLRDGPGTEDRDARRRAQSRIGRHDPAFLDQRGPNSTDCSHSAYRIFAEQADPQQIFASSAQLVTTSYCHSGSSLGADGLSSSAAGNR
jgi:hypothetical protein